MTPREKLIVLAAMKFYIKNKTNGGRIPDYITHQISQDTGLSMEDCYQIRNEIQSHMG
jgi:hypothetical protein